MSILSCELVGLVDWSQQLDPEDLRNTLLRYHELVKSIVEQSAGVVARFLEESILVYFGHPHALEDHSERAALCGLALVNGIRRLDTTDAFNPQVRIGVASGLVVAGDLTNKESTREELIVGSTPKLAAALRSIAEPSTVLVSAATKELNGELFNYAERESHDFPGIAGPTICWEVLSPRSGAMRLAALHKGSIDKPLVGRQLELDVLAKCWQKTKLGHAQILTVSGEAGYGKSRLAHALTKQIEKEDKTLLRYDCSPHFTNSPLHPVISQIEHAAKFDRKDSPDTKASKLDKLLNESGGKSRRIRYVAALISLLLPDDATQLRDTPERQKELTLEALKDEIVNLAQVKPVLAIVEDAHWMDPTTLELIERIANAGAEHGIMLLITHRPEFSLNWQAGSEATRLELAPLSNRESLQLIRNFVGSEATLASNTTELILERSGGNPLYLEELTKTVAGGSEEAVPLTLQASLMQQIERLDGAKDKVQVAAVIGREFDLELLSRVMDLDEVELLDVLEHLIQDDIIQRRGGRYQFRHRLLQEAAYESLLREKRTRLHLRIVASLESLHPARMDQQPEIVAHHYTQAREFSEAIPFWRKAGLRAASRAAYKDSAQHYVKALELLAALPVDPEQLRLELELRGLLGLSVAGYAGFSDPEVEASHLRALEICDQLRDDEARFCSLRRLFNHYLTRAEYSTGMRIANECVALAEQLQRSDYLIEAYHALGWAQVKTGSVERGVSSLEQSLEIYNSANGDSFDFPTELNPAVAASSVLGMVTAMQGKAKIARQHADRSVAVAQRLESPFELASAYTWYSITEQVLGDYEHSHRQAARAIDLSKTHGFVFWELLATIHASVKPESNDAANAAKRISDLIAEYHSIGARSFTGVLYAELADTLMAAGDFESARKALEQAFVHSQQQNEVFFDAGLYLQRACVLEKEGQLESAGASFRQAQVQANKDSYALLELRALQGLNRTGLPLSSAESSRSRELSRRLNNLGGGVPDILATEEAITLADRDR